MKKNGAGFGSVVVGLVFLGCGASDAREQRRVEAPPAAATVAARPAVSTSASAAARAPSNAAQTTAAPDPKSPAAVAARLVSDWCSTTETEDKPACSLVTFEVLDERKTGLLETAVLRLNAAVTPIEERQLLYMRRGDRIAVAPLAAAVSSGVGGFSHDISISNVSVVDRFGDAEPEWAAEIDVDVHDSDMGLCRLSGTHDRHLVVCGSTPDGFQCAKTPLVQSIYEEQGDTSARDCGKPRSTNRGFFLVAKHANKDVTLSPATGHRRITTSVRPPLVGKLSITNLMSSAALPVQHF